VKYSETALAILAVVSVSLALAEDFRTTNGKEYKNVTVKRVEPDGIILSSKFGISKVYFTELPKDVQERFHYAAPANPQPQPQQARPVKSASATRINQSGIRVTHTPIALTDSQRPSERNAGPTLFVVAFVSLSGVVVFFKLRSRAARKAIHEKLMAELNDYAQVVKQTNKVPTVPTQVFLKPGESALYECSSSLYETRAVRHYQAGHVGFRVAKGVWIGGSQGQAVSNQEWSKIDSGRFTISNTRLIFDGTRASRNVPLNKIISAQAWLDGIEDAVENRQKNFIFSAPNPYIAQAIIQFLCKGESATPRSPP
jgi:hypothetical protein